MLDREKPIECPNCSSVNIDNYCSNCGQKIYTKRFTLKQFFEIAGNALNLERGFLHTALGLFRNPGIVINDYLKGKTKSYFNPFNYILIIGGIYAFLFLSLGIFDNSMELSNSLSKGQNPAISKEALAFQQQLAETMKKYVNLLPLLLIPFASLFSKRFYRKQKLYYGEHLIINTFIFGQAVIISILLSLIILIFPGFLQMFFLFSGVASLCYFTYAFYCTFKQPILITTIKTIGILVLGYLLFLLVFLVVFALIVFTLLLSGIESFGLTP